MMAGNMQAKELGVLTAVLDVFEREALRGSGSNNQNGSYATADSFDYDDDDISISLEWGIQDMGSGDSHSQTEKHTLARSVLTSGISIPEMVDQIKRA